VRFFFALFGDFERNCDVSPTICEERKKSVIFQASSAANWLILELK